jgi:hypothetical protein
MLVKNDELNIWYYQTCMYFPFDSCLKQLKNAWGNPQDIYIVNHSLFCITVRKLEDAKGHLKFFVLINVNYIFINFSKPPF